MAIYIGEIMSKDEDMLKELKQIRELLAAKPAPPPPPPKGMWNEFKSFIENYKVMGLAVAFILGLYLGQLVQSMVTDLIMPIIGLALPGMDNLSTLNSSSWQSGVRSWRLSGSLDNFHHRSLRNLPASESHQKMGNKIENSPNALF